MHSIFGLHIHRSLLVAGAVAAAGVLMLAVVGVALLIRRRTAGKAAKPGTFYDRWQQDVQRLCAKSGTWPLAIANADKMLDEALKKRRFRGKTMGERLVAAQRRLTDNDGVWFGHKLSNKITQEDVPEVKKEDVMSALRGFRQALKDLGVIE